MQDIFHLLVQQSWNKFIKGSSAFRLARQIELLKEEIKIWSCYSKEFQDTNRAHYKLPIHQTHVMNNRTETIAYKKVVQQNSQVEKDFIDYDWCNESNNPGSYWEIEIIIFFELWPILGSEKTLYAKLKMPKKIGLKIKRESHALSLRSFKRDLCLTPW